MAKPRVVIQDVNTGEYRSGPYCWVDDIDRARVWRSEGVAKNAYGSGREVRYVPVRITVLDV